MNKMKIYKKECFFIIGLLLHLFYPTDSRNLPRTQNITEETDSWSPSVTYRIISNKYIVLDNGNVQVSLSTPSGRVIGIHYHGISNLLQEHNNPESNRGYWDMVWNRPTHSEYEKLHCTSYRIVYANDDGIEISFTRTWDHDKGGKTLPLNIDKRYVMIKGVDGFYTYAKFERFKGWPAMNIDQTRVAFKLNKHLFRYMAVSDSRQGFMPTEDDRANGVSIDYKEAVLLTNPSDQFFKDRVDDKYQYSDNIKDNRVHGWVSFNPLIGFWVITPSNEYRMGGPLKQELSSHVGPTSLEDFFSSHYAGPEASMTFADGEAWEKVYGPTFIYLNSAPQDTKNPGWTLWEDAKNQLYEEMSYWPYNFVGMESGFPGANLRGEVWGRLLVHDGFISQSTINGSYAYVGLAPPGEQTSWQRENKGYQFWTEADSDGHFSIKNVRAGTYNLFAWVPGFIGDYRYEAQITVSPGGSLGLGDLVFWPARAGPTLWEIGVPDRTAAEFYVPDPRPDRINPVFGHEKDKFRQYGLWERYTDLYPDKDLVYTVGTSYYPKDWFYAHVTRRMSDHSYAPATWTILFDLANADKEGTYYFRIALASSSLARLEVRINDPNRARADYGTIMIGRDNAIARHGIHGLYRLFSIPIPGWKLYSGRNAFYITQPVCNSPFNGFMYDYLRLEGPARE